MKDEPPTATEEVAGLLSRLQEAHKALMAAVAAVPARRFQRENAEGDSPRRVLERSVDDVNLYYGRLVAAALSLPQPPELLSADFGSRSEAEGALRAAHRSLAKLLHDLTAEDLGRKTRLESTSEFTLRQVLETAIAHYNLRADQLKAMVEGQEKGGLDDTSHGR